MSTETEVLKQVQDKLPMEDRNGVLRPKYAFWEILRKQNEKEPHSS